MVARRFTSGLLKQKGSRIGGGARSPFPHKTLIECSLEQCSSLANAVEQVTERAGGDVRQPLVQDGVTNLPRLRHFSQKTAELLIKIEQFAQSGNSKLIFVSFTCGLAHQPFTATQTSKFCFSDSQ